MIVKRQLADKFSSDHERFLICQANLLSCLDSIDGWLQTGEPYHCRKYHIDGLCLNYLLQSVTSGINFYIGLVLQLLGKGFIMVGIGNHNCRRTELASLCGKFSPMIVGRQCINLV